MHARFSSLSLWKTQLLLFISTLLTMLLVSCGGGRENSLEINGLRATIWVSDYLAKTGEPFDIRLTLTNMGIEPLILEADPDRIWDPPVRIIIRTPHPTGDNWLVVAEFPAECPEIPPGESCMLSSTWAMPEDLGSDAVIVAGVIWYNASLHEVAVGIAQPPSPF